MFTELSLYIGHETEYCHTKKITGRHFIRPAPGEKGIKEETSSITKVSNGFNLKYQIFCLGNTWIQNKDRDLSVLEKADFHFQTIATKIKPDGYVPLLFSSQLKLGVHVNVLFSDKKQVNALLHSHRNPSFEKIRMLNYVKLSSL